MKRLAVLNVVGLTESLISNITPHLKSCFNNYKTSYLKEQFPAVTCTSQVCMLTGKNPSDHGIVANGWYFKELAEIGFWKQNNNLIDSPKIWDVLKKQNNSFTCAQLFWWYNMYADVDYSITPRPHYPADGRKIFDIYTQPSSLKEGVVEDIGEFPFFNFWGPKSGIESSDWISKSAKYVFEKHQPNLNLVYLPHLDYSLQQLGPNHPDVQNELKKIDVVVGDLISFYKDRDTEVMIVSEYGITEVNQVLHPNRVLRKVGYLQVQKSLSWELLDCGASEAFAVSDHQICHIYVKDKRKIPEIVCLFEKQEGHLNILFGEAIKENNLNHDRSGDIILMSKPNFWYSYYYWLDDRFAPDFSRCIDIHRKSGYDPCELFIDPKLLFPKLKMIKTLIKKFLGFRYYMDIIPLDTSLIKGSHGTPVEDRQAGPLMMCSYKKMEAQIKTLPITSVYQIILNYFQDIDD